METLEGYILRKSFNSPIPHVWEVGFGSGNVTMILSRASQLTVAVDIDAQLARNFPTNVVPLIGSVQSLLRAITHPVIDLVYIDVGNNEETCRHIIQQFKNKAKLFVIKEYPWLESLLTNNESDADIERFEGHMEVRWMN